MSEPSPDIQPETISRSGYQFGPILSIPQSIRQGESQRVWMGLDLRNQEGTFDSAVFLESLTGKVSPCDVVGFFVSIRLSI